MPCEGVAVLPAPSLAVRRRGFAKRKGVLMTDNTPRASADRLRTFISQAFEAAGLTADDARILGELIAEADLRGTDTHGVFRMPLYVRRIKAGGINLRPNIRIVEELPRPPSSTATTRWAIWSCGLRRKPPSPKPRRRASAGWARMSNHAGPAALYAMMPLTHDMIGSTSRSAATITCRRPAARRPARHNPIAVAIPADREPAVVMDMAPTVAAFARCGSRRPRRADAGRLDDRPRRQPADRRHARQRRLSAADRRLQGYALSLIIGSWRARSTRRPSRDIVDFIKFPGSATNTGIRSRRESGCVLSVEVFKRNVDQAVRSIRESQRLPGFERIWLPGSKATPSGPSALSRNSDTCDPAQEPR